MTKGYALKKKVAKAKGARGYPNREIFLHRVTEPRTNGCGCIIDPDPSKPLYQHMCEQTKGKPTKKVKSHG